MTRTKSRHWTSPRHDRRADFRHRLGKTALAVPLILSGCASTPKPPYPTTRSEISKSLTATPPPAGRFHDPLAVTELGPLTKLPDAYSSAALIQRLLAIQQKQIERGASKRQGQKPELALSEIRAKSNGAGSRRKGAARRSRTEPLDSGPEGETWPTPMVATAEPAMPQANGGKTRKPGNAGRQMPAFASKNPPNYWDMVRGALVLTGVDHERVTAQLEHLRQHPAAVEGLMRRAEPYLSYLLEQIRREGLPADLIMVPMVESAFETGALSPKQAAGIWQFIPSTGQRYGLHLAENFDGRYDTHAATIAALKYLKHLHQLFDGDWLLAFAGYNAGEGAVRRAIEASKKAGLSGTFWDLDLPAETEAYVVKIVALSRLVADPSAYGLKPRQAVNLPFLTRVQAAPEVKISDLIANSGISPEEFFKLNPAFKPDVEPPAEVHNFFLPPNRAEALQAANLPGTKVFAPRRVVVQKGETLSILAKRHGVPELKLAEWNGISPKTHLKAGQELVVYPV